MDGVRLDFGNLMAPGLEGGVDPQSFAGELSRTFAEAHGAVERLRSSGALGFLDLPYAKETVGQVRQLADGFGQWFEDVVVLGIGGSGLGAKTLKDALLGPYWNDRSAEERDHFPRLHVVDNPDPFTMAGLLERLDLARTLFNVVSKSGATAETMAQYLVVREAVERAVGADSARGHFLFTTDPVAGALRRIGEAEEIPMLPIPENVGGRFSVLSPVGLLPAAVCGVAVDALLEGASAMEERCRSDRLAENPAAVLATLLHHADRVWGRPIHVLMPYSDRLWSLALWFQQLWAESLGKARRLDGTPGLTGPTPLAALGATDQHSLLQLLMEGPQDKVVVFVEVEDHGVDRAIPRRHPEMDELSYLGGHSLGELINTERRATAEALRRAGRPNASLAVSSVSAETVGQMLMLLQAATVYAGSLYGVDPLDQPGVELSKRLTYGLLGRAGAERPAMEAQDGLWTV
ncbi:MAG TPA: glucose-6-phosphate isomerase [Longimicrobiales bacterium]|nr:glucose-6-phosphate isomerase [Longimicrobiales bacterium]